MIVRNGWHLLVIPALADEDEDYRIGPGPQDIHHRRAGDLLLPERETREDLDRIRRELGSVNYSAQYQQRPIPPGGAIIKRDWIRSYDHEPRRLDRKIVSWDTASTIAPHSSYSVGTVWGLAGLNHYLLDVHRGRWETPELQRRIAEIHKRERPDTTLIEAGDVGRAVAQSLREANLLWAAVRKPRLDKEARLLRHAAKFENGQIFLPREAPWLAKYLDELLAFPNARFNDQVDSTTQALTELARHRSGKEAHALDGQYGPTGRRTRASLTNTRSPRRPDSDQDHFDDAADAAPALPIVRRVPAEYELGQDRPTPPRRIR